MSATARKQLAPAPSPDAAVDPIAALAGQIVELKLDQEAMSRELDELRAMVLADWSTRIWGSGNRISSGAPATHEDHVGFADDGLAILLIDIE
jgi:hypothetical protein